MLCRPHNSAKRHQSNTIFVPGRIIYVTNVGDWRGRPLRSRGISRRADAVCEANIPLLILGRSDSCRRRGPPNTLLVWRCVSSVVCAYSSCVSGSLRSVPTRTIIRPEARDAGFKCVRVASPQQPQHETTKPEETASSPWTRVLALVCSSKKTPYLQ